MDNQQPQLSQESIQILLQEYQREIANLSNQVVIERASKQEYKSQIEVLTQQLNDLAEELKQYQGDPE